MAFTPRFSGSGAWRGRDADTGTLSLIIMYDDIARYGARIAFEIADPNCPQPDSPETELSVGPLTSYEPSQ